MQLTLGLAIISTLVSACVCSYDCLEEKSCFSSSITYSQTDSNIRCYGYRSCAETTQIKSTTKGVDCDGSYSCYKSNLISTTSVYCRGLFACANVKEMKIDGPITCRGEKACANTKMSVISAATIFCDGDRSCQGSKLFAQGFVGLRGNLAALNSMIYTNISGISIHFYGANSGYNATVICGISHTCDVYCHGNACDNINGIFCSDYNDTSCAIGIFYDSFTSDIPLDDVADTIQLPSLVDITGTTYENSFYPCESNITNAINCGDYQECASSALLNSTNAPLCCTAKEACYMTGGKATIPNNNSWIGETAIRCDGIGSCRSDSMLYGVNGNIFVSGHNAAAYISSNDIPIIKTGNRDLYDIFCGGYYACIYAHIYDCNNLYCNGALSCENLLLSYNIHNVFAYGSQAARNARFERIDNVYCAGYESCDNITINYVYDSVYGHNSQVFYESNIMNIKNTLIASGYQAAYLSTIYNVTNIYCIGNQSCYGSTIRGIHNTLYINGDNAISGNSIIISESNFEDNGTLYIYINGTNDESTFDIYCNVTDVCKIGCLSSDACTKLNVHCQDYNCFVDCDESGINGTGINCPYSGNWNEWAVTDEPTSIPTTYPTTAVPTAFPTSIMPTNVIHPSSYSTVAAHPTSNRNYSTTTVELTSEANYSSNSSTNTIFNNDTQYSSSASATVNATHTVGSDSSDSNANQSDFYVEMAIIITAAIIIGILLCIAHFHFNKKRMKNTEASVKNEIELGNDNVNDPETPITAGNKDGNNKDNNNNQLDSGISYVIHDTPMGANQPKKNERVSGEIIEIDEIVKDKNEGDIDIEPSMSHSDMYDIDSETFEKFSEKQIVVWIEKLLLQKNIDKNIVQEFVKEFATKNVSAKMIIEFVKNDQLLEQFINQFSFKNQAFTIWVAIKSATKDITITNTQFGEEGRSNV